MIRLAWLWFSALATLHLRAFFRMIAALKNYPALEQP
jgi:hypothetical protein